MRFNRTLLIGDIYAHPYERKVRTNGQETGELESAALIKGRLLQITYVKIGDGVVYQKDRDGIVRTSLDLGSNSRTGTHD